MNFSTSLNEFETFDEFLTNQMGFTFLLECLYTYVSTPVAVLGFIFNLISFVVFFDTDFNIPLYKYFRIYSINSAVVNLVHIFIFISFSYRLVPLGNTYASQALFDYALLPLCMAGYFYGTVLDIVITVDRIANFKQSVKHWFQKFTTKTCLALYFVCGLINIPYHLIFMPKFRVVPINSTFNYTIWFTSLSPFAVTETGRVLTFLIYLFRDFSLMATEIVLNLVSIYFMKKYFDKKLKLQADQLSKTSLGQHHVAYKTERRLTLLVVILCLMSIVEHIMVIFVSVYPQLTTERTMAYYYFVFLGLFEMNFKHAINFPLFFLFNKQFRRACLKLMLKN
jgi:hypothetical protein